MAQQQSDKAYPVKGKMRPYDGRVFGENNHVHVHRVGKRRKHVDEAGNIFVKAFGEWWKFPQEVEY